MLPEPTVRRPAVRYLSSYRVVARRVRGAARPYSELQSGLAISVVGGFLASLIRRRAVSWTSYCFRPTVPPIVSTAAAGRSRSSGESRPAATASQRIGLHRPQCLPVRNHLASAPFPTVDP